MARHGRDEERHRSERNSRSRDDRRSSGESKEERLLRKAREYVEREERKKKASVKDDKSSRDRHSGRRHEKDRHDSKRHHEHDRKGYRRSSGEKRRHRHDRSDESDNERREKRKHRHDKSDESSDNERQERKRGESSSNKRHREKDRRHHSESSRKRHKHEKKKKKSLKGEEKKKGFKKIKVNKQDLFPLGDIKGSPPSELLDVEKDYFAYHQHLWVYLYREEGRLFGDLTSEEAREAFERFTRRYNDGKLEAAYYDPKGMPSEALEECKTTRHAWSFNTSETERASLKHLQEGVRKQTEYNASDNKAESGPLPQIHHKSSGSLPTNVPEERRRMTPEERLAQRTANRRLREHARTAEEEFSGGRKEGRERQIELRKEKAAAIHGSARDREETAMGGVELDDAALYGGGGSGETSFQDALAREKRRTERRKQERDKRVEELQQKERDKQEATLKMLGLTGIKPGQKITIAPRKDG